VTGIIDSALTHTRAILSTLMLVLVAGIYTYAEIPKESDPDINIPIIYVVMTHDGISAEDAERLLVRPMEQELRSIEGVKEMRSTGREGSGAVTLEFEAGFDADKALNDVREKVDLAKPDLPDETDEPTVHEVNFSLFPVVIVTLSGAVPERALLKLSRDLQEAIETIPSVLKAEIGGDRDEMLEVLIDPVQVESYGLTMADATSAVRSSNLLVAAGAQDTGKGRFSLKVPGLLETAYDLMNLPIKTDADAVVVLGDVAEVRRTFKDPESFARFDGERTLALEVSKRSGENIIDTIERVHDVVEAERQNWPSVLRDTIKVAYSQDKSDDIRNMLRDLQNNVISAVLLVMIVIVAALGLRTAGLVGIAIPGSFLMGILVISMLGLTINVVVLFALILAVGMLVDGAIVVTEYADREMMGGEPRARAYGLAAKRMSWPIIASTATTLAAFMPLLFWPGVVGEFMKFLPITLLATLSASLLMALIFVPTLGALIGGPSGGAQKSLPKQDHGGGARPADEQGGFTGAYCRVLRAALRHPAKVLLVALMTLIGVQWTYAEFGRGVEFFPEIEPKFAQLQIRARGNLASEEKDRLVRQTESRILGMKELESVYSRTGRPQENQEAEDIIGTISVEFIDWRLRRPAKLILAEIKSRTADLAGIYIDPREQEFGPPVGKDIQIQLSSVFPELLTPALEKILAELENFEGLINIEDSRPLPGIDWQIKVDRSQAAKFGASVDTIGSAIQMASTGVKLGEYRPDDSTDEIDIRVRYPREFRTIVELDNIRINTGAGRVPISNFVERIAKPSVGSVNRVDGKRVLTVKADVTDGLLVNDKVKEIQAWIKNAGIDSRIKIEFKGEDEEQKKAQAFLSKAFIVALFIMAIILVTQFNSFYSAFLILSAVIMSTIGVFIGLLVTGQPFGIVMGGVGVIALAGIVVNNNIVLIDTYDRMVKESDEPVMETILRTGAQRLRPVLLTSITTVLGLMPMVLGVNIDFVTREVAIGAPSSQMWMQLATAIVFGLSFSTMLTLLVTPSALMVRANVSAWRKHRRQIPNNGRG
jgi:multidrug efflux pump